VDLPLRETRRFKTKGFTVSFGDFILPLVGLVAIVLLFVAGKIFLFSDLQLDSQPIPNISPPDIPRVTINPEATRVNAGESSSVARIAQPSSHRVASGDNLVLDFGPENRPLSAVLTDGDQDGAYQSVDNSREEIAREIIVVSPPAPMPAPTPAPTQAVTPSPTQQPRPTPAASRPAQQQVQPTGTATRNWMVQVGAFSTNVAADAVVEQLTEAGHTVTVDSGRTLHRVLVQAGPTRQDAMNLAARLAQSGFSGAFIVPPRRP